MTDRVGDLIDIHPGGRVRGDRAVTAPLPVPQISPRLAAYLAAYPDGPQV